jgi:hypothetical protein
MANNFYTRTTGLDSFFTSSTSGTEPDMRQELINTLDGYYPEVAKGTTGLLRKMRRDDNNILTPCTCVDSVTNEPDKDRFCPICFGEGSMWDEEEISYYRVYEGSDTMNTQKDRLMKPGLLNQPFVIFYIRYSNEITKEDKIVEIELEDDGTASEPMRRKRIFRISNFWEYRADNGKLEYYKVFCYLDSVKHLNAPSYGAL